MVLILGKTGYISKRFQDFFDYKKIPYQAISLKDYTTPYLIESIIKSINPTFVINSIGYTGVPNIEACEEQKGMCLFVNVVLAEIIADACKRLDIPLGFVSSGCIYTQNTASWWHHFTERDTPNFSFAYNNCSWYSGTKALGESVVSKSWEKTYIWRVRLPFNHIPHDKNVVSKFLKFPKVISISNSFTNLDEFVSIAYYSMVNGIPFGIYNMTNPGDANARSILNLAKKHDLIKPVYEYFKSEEEFDKISTTPRSNCILDSSKIDQYFPFEPIYNSFEICFKNWNTPEKYPFWN